MKLTWNINREYWLQYMKTIQGKSEPCSKKIETHAKRHYAVNDMICCTCLTDTRLINEYYMVKNEIWHYNNPNPQKILCIGCLEKQLGRKLNKNDFINCPVNDLDDKSKKSERLISRLNSNQARK